MFLLHRESPSFQPAITESLISAFPFSDYQMSYFRFYYLQYPGAFWVAQWERIFLSTQETQVQFLDQKDPLKEAMETHSSIIARKIPWTEGTAGLQSMGSQRFRHDRETDHAHMHVECPFISAEVCCQNSDQLRVTETWLLCPKHKKVKTTSVGGRSTF